MFNLKSKYTPAGDQGRAIKELLEYIKSGEKWQTLWGVTGSGKTFTMANIIQEVKKPTLVIAHNKTLAAQLAQEFKEFFPENAVHYFVSYYDYYQPEAYIQKTDTYIEKEATINEEIDRLRHAASQDLLTRKDVIIVASVSCIYGIGNIEQYTQQIFRIEKSKNYKIEDLLKKLVNIQYKRAGDDFKPGNFKVSGDILEIFPSSKQTVYRIEFWGDEVTEIVIKDNLTGRIYESLEYIEIFPAKHTVTTKEKIKEVVPIIKNELESRLETFKKSGDLLKHERLKTKVEYDMEMMMEVGYVNGIENYSRYLDGRKSGDAPYTLIDYFGDDFLCFIDESHMTIPQIGAMYAGDKSRKDNLVENGFRLPSALDNRPLRFHEFESKIKQAIAVSATPGKYEIERSCDNSPIPLDFDKNKEENLLGEKFYNFDPIRDGSWESSMTCRIVLKIIRPTGLLDPEIEIKPMEYMVDDIMDSISKVIDKGERMLITTITKKSSEELTDYLLDSGIKVNYLHSEVDTLDRLEILKDLREGTIDVIVGVNLLREGLDLPEVSTIAILDADKQGFLRSESSLIQIIGRAARNSNGKVNMYVEKITPIRYSAVDKENYEDSYFGKLYRLEKGNKFVNDDSLVFSQAMKKAIDLTYYRRNFQNEYNQKNNLIPKTIFSEIKDMGVTNKKGKGTEYKNIKNIPKLIKKLELEMDLAASNMEYEKAAEIRDEIIELKKRG